jgi:2-oxoglutarate dehydrogenase E1 component
VERDVLARITEVLTRVPGNVDVHPKLAKWMEARARTLESGEGVDWAFAEALAFGSLVLEGVPVRLSGQDSVRGTFSQRHLLLHDDDTDVSWMALQHLDPDQAPFVAVDSPLSEEAVVGFEYGFSVGDPATLVMWEAQFGDFVNEAQVMIDQFLAGSVAKWGQPSGLVLLLPHGYEGQGPEHSSARPERFLQLAAEDNLRVAVPSTPAQYFHLLRRQMCEGLPRPLVVLTPKSLLRHPRAVSSVSTLAEGRFEPLLIDSAEGGEENATRLVLCSGKIYYDLAAHREKAPGISLCRVEELYPFPLTALRQLRARHPKAEVVWVQEEARNMGAWTFVNDRLRREEEEEIRIRYVGRPESASPATGYHEVHRREQERIVHEAMGLPS